jgi:twitching motility protein PilT
VLGTLHTQNAPETVDRIIDIFPANQQAQNWATLADTLKAVVAQGLCKGVDGQGGAPR